MGTVAQSLSTIAPQAQHPGRCCALRRFFVSDTIDDDDRAAVQAVMDNRSFSAAAAADILQGVGVDISAGQVTKHRCGYCRCCEIHGG